MKMRARQFALSLFLLFTVLLYSCGPKPAPTPTPTEAPVQVTSPAVGSLMIWVDGSTLLFNGDTWIYQSEVTNLQFSLCVEAGNCQAPAGSSDFNNIDLNNAPAQIIGPEAPQEYCNWAGGRVPTAEEASALALQAYTPGGVDTTSILIGLLSPGSLNGIRCIVDAPHPMAPACETSAFYLNGAPPGLDTTVTEAGRFCQKGEGFVTLDFDIPAGGSLRSVNGDGDCSVVGDSRVLCSSQSGPSGAGEAAIQGNFLPAVHDSSIPAGGQMQCLPGYEVNGDLPTQCDFNKLLPAVRKDSGPAVAELQSSQEQSTGQISLVVFQLKSMQSGNRQQSCPKPLTFSEKYGKCVYEIPAEVLARTRTNDCPPGSFGISIAGMNYCFPTEPAPDADGHCPEGYLLNATTGRCERDFSPLRGLLGGLAGLFAAPDKEGNCPDGYSLDASGICVRNPAPNADGSCPEGYSLDPSGACTRSPNPLPGFLTDFANMFTAPDKEGNCPDGYGLDPSGLCVRGRPATNTDGCPAGWYRASINGIGLGCLPNFPVGCPVGTYFDKELGVCVSPGHPSIDALVGFHFDAAMQCSLSDLPSGRYPGCPAGEPFDPATGACDSENIYVGGGKVLHTIHFDFSAPVCSSIGGPGSGGSGGSGDGGDSGGCTLSDAACAPSKFDPVKCSCY